MKRVIRLLMCVAIGGAATGVAQAQPSRIRITSPAEGTAVTPGETVIVTIEADTATVLTRATAWVLPLTQRPETIDRAPFAVPVRIPPDRVGSVELRAMAADAAGDVL